MGPMDGPNRVRHDCHSKFPQQFSHMIPVHTDEFTSGRFSSTLRPPPQAASPPHIPRGPYRLHMFYTAMTELPEYSCRLCDPYAETKRRRVPPTTSRRSILSRPQGARSHQGPEPRNSLPSRLPFSALSRSSSFPAALQYLYVSQVFCTTRSLLVGYQILKRDQPNRNAVYCL